MPASRHGARFKILLARGRADQFTHVAKLRELGALARNSDRCMAFENFLQVKKFSKVMHRVYKTKLNTHLIF